MQSYVRKIGSGENLMERLIDQRPKTGVASTLTKTKEECRNANNEIFCNDGDAMSSYTAHVKGRSSQGYYTYTFYDFISQTSTPHYTTRKTYASRAVGEEKYNYTTRGDKGFGTQKHTDTR